MLVANFESLNVCKSEVYADVQGNQEIELFMNTIVPPLLGFVSEAPFRIVVGLLALFIERNNMIWVARSKVMNSFMVSPRFIRSACCETIRWDTMIEYGANANTFCLCVITSFLAWFGLFDTVLEPRRDT